MAYFLKQSHLKGRTYLSIVESFYSHKKRGAAHRTFKSLSSVETWISRGIDDPISYFQKQVDDLNLQRKQEAFNEIQNLSPKRYIGYFLINSILNKLKIKNYVDLFKINTNFNFDLYQALSSLIFSRLINPCSKYKTYTEVIPYLFGEYNFSYDQLLSAIKFLGNDYEKFVELFTYRLNKTFGINTNTTYFDCTNFYFEIDKEDVLRKYGPSKENRNCPIVGLGLLLDSNQLPIGMKIFPGNQSEKPILRSIINELKSQNNINGKTIHVADKGLNCTKNIFDSRKNGDGYLFSKSVKQLPENEITWILLDNDYKDVRDTNGNILYKYKFCIDKFPYTYIDKNNKKHHFELTEKRLVTYNPSLAKKRIYEINKLVEKAQLLCLYKAKKSEYGECSKYVDFKGNDDSKAKVTINEEKIRRDKELAGYNLLITSETKMSAEEIYNTYHNLWRIEESFRIMKSDLDARPAFMKTEETIKGHFLICYLSVLLERILQFKILNNSYSSEEIFKLFKNLIVVKADNGYINIATKNQLMVDLKNMTNLPLTNYVLSETQIKKVMNYRL